MLFWSGVGKARKMTGAPCPQDAGETIDTQKWWMVYSAHALVTCPIQIGAAATSKRTEIRTQGDSMDKAHRLALAVALAFGVAGAAPAANAAGERARAMALQN
jgi:cytochrome bd-type quinol oxidase subunit 2